MSGSIESKEQPTTKPAGSSKDLHPVVWLGFPLITLALCWVTPLLGHSRWSALMVGELAFIELATVGFLVAGFVMSVLIFSRRSKLPGRVGLLMLLVGCAGLFFALEEANYGQHYFGYETPEAIAAQNRAREFNTHKIEWLRSVTNTAPRRALLVCCLVGGIILPIVLRKRLGAPGARGKASCWIIPNYRLVPAALLAVLSTVPEKFLKAFNVVYAKTSYAGMAFVEPGGELKEFGFAMVILLTLWSVWVRMRED